MTSNFRHKLAVITASTFFGLVAVEGTPAQAATLTYDFTTEIISGPQVGNTSWGGYFSFDDSTLTGNGVENFGISEGLSVFLDMGSRTYIETDDSSFPISPLVTFENGNLLRLDFVPVDPGYPYAYGSIFGTSFFGYGEGDTEASEGIVSYTSRSTESVPEPNLVLGLSLFGLGWLAKKKLAVRVKS